MEPKSKHIVDFPELLMQKHRIPRDKRRMPPSISDQNRKQYPYDLSQMTEYGLIVTGNLALSFQCSRFCVHDKVAADIN